MRELQIPCVSWQVQERLTEYYRDRFYLFDNNEIFEANQSESILRAFTMAVRRYGYKLFLADNLMTALSDSDEETKAQGKFANALKKFATCYYVHVLLVAHPRKVKAGEKLGQDDIGGSSATIRLADSAIVVEKPNLRIIKNREGGLCRLNAATAPTVAEFTRPIRATKATSAGTRRASPNPPSVRTVCLNTPCASPRAHSPSKRRKPMCISLPGDMKWSFSK